MRRDSNFVGVFGHVNLDHIMTLERLPSPNTSIEVVSERLYFGGTGGNIARSCAALGVPVALASFVGRDFPVDYGDALSSTGVDTTDLTVVRDSLTPTCWIMSDGDGNQFAVINQGPMKHQDRFRMQTHTIDSSEIVHFSTGRPGYYMEAAGRARNLGKRIAFDPSQEIHYVYTPDVFMKMLRGTEFFFCNESELDRAVELAGASRPGDLLKFTGNLIVTLGRRGSRIYRRDGTVLRIPPAGVDAPVDATGAGDAFRGGFYAALYRRLPLETCGLAGSITAASVISFRGPQPMPGEAAAYPDMDDVIQRAEKMASSRTGIT